MRILVFPKVSENPYQELLYRPMRARGIVVDYLLPLTTSATLNLLTWIPLLAYHRMRGYDVLHLHWSDVLAPRAKIWRTYVGARLAYWHYCVFLKAIKFFGYQLVWTAHNVLPHEQAFVNDVAARHQLVQAADLVIAHTHRTLEQLEHKGFTPKRSAVIALGNYIGVYPNSITRIDARKQLGLGNEVFVYLYLGNIREYKGVDDLLNAYSGIRTDQTQLIVAGTCSTPAMRAALNRHRNEEKIVWIDGSVSDEELQVYFNAADVVVLPFKRITTSSSAMLALSFGKTVIIPNIGDLKDLPDSATFKYEPGEENLADMLTRVRNSDAHLQEKSRAALEYARSHSWDSIAEKLAQAVRELFKR